MPYVGQTVHYHSYGTPNGEYKPEKRAAIITGIKRGEIVDLCVLNPTGMFFNQTVERGTGGGEWEYLPHDREQYRLPESNAISTKQFIENHYNDKDKGDI